MQANSIWLTTRHSGKMAGMLSINTSAMGNSFCANRTSGICKSCYAKVCEKMRSTMKDKFMLNNKALSSLLPKKELPVLSLFRTDIVRLHAFGELINKEHYQNFVNLCKQNKDITFALWTKRPELIEGIRKPKNLILIYSETELNIENPTIPKGFDKVFTVFTGDYIKKNSIELNCHAENCFTCRKCYTKGGTKIIREKRK